MDLKGIVYGGVDRVYVAHVKAQCLAFVNTVMNLRLP
jgi:hypothetical protein